MLKVLFKFMSKPSVLYSLRIVTVVLVYIGFTFNIYSSNDSLVKKDSDIYEIFEYEQDIKLDSQLVEDMFEELSLRSSLIAVPEKTDTQDTLIVNFNDFRLLEEIANLSPYKIRIITQLILGSRDPLRNYIQSKEDIKDLVRQHKGSINKLSYLHSILYSSSYDTYMETLVQQDPTLSKVSSRSLSLDKMIIVASLHATYTVQKKLNYDASITEFYNIFQKEIRSFLNKKIFSRKDFIDLIHTANLLYPFSFYNINSNLLLNWDGVISYQRKWGLDYRTFLKLESEIGFNLEHLKLFDPIFFASSLLKIANDPSISIKHKNQCISIAKQILYKDDDAYIKVKEGRLNIYITLAAADILKKYGILLQKLEEDNSSLSQSLRIFFSSKNNYLFHPDSNLIDKIQNSTNNNQLSPKLNYIQFSINGLFLRSVACGASQMVSYILNLHKTKRLTLSELVINEAIRVAINFGQVNTLNLLLNLNIEIKNLDTLIENAKKNLQYEVILLLIKKSNLWDNFEKISMMEELKYKIIRKTEERFNIFRNYSEILSCMNLFSIEHQP